MRQPRLNKAGSAASRLRGEGQCEAGAGLLGQQRERGLTHASRGVQRGKDDSSLRERLPYREADARRTGACFTARLALFVLPSLLASIPSNEERLLEEVGRVEISNKRLSKIGRGEDGNETEQRGRGMGNHHPGASAGRLEAKGCY